MIIHNLPVRFGGDLKSQTKREIIDFLTRFWGQKIPINWIISTLGAQAMGSTRNAFVALLINCGDPWIIPNLQLHRRFVSNNHIFQRYPWLTSDIIASVNTFSHKFKTNFMSSSSQTTTIFLISGIILIFYKFSSSNKERQSLLCRSYNQILLTVTIFKVNICLWRGTGVVYLLI